MKQLFLLSIVCAFAFSCKKDDRIPLFKKEISGTWELEKFIGYPFSTPALPPGNGNLLVLGEDGSFERRKHDTLEFKGTYSLIVKKDCYERDSDLLFSTNENTSPDYISIREGKLTLSTPNCYQDGGTTYYRRVE